MNVTFSVTQLGIDVAFTIIAAFRLAMAVAFAAIASFRLLSLALIKAIVIVVTMISSMSCVKVKTGTVVIVT